MSKQPTLEQLEASFIQASTDERMQFTAEVISGDVPVLQVSIADREEFPVYITLDDSQILCVTHLWKEGEIKPGCKEELLDELMTMNLPMPLSAFSKIGTQYVIFGALSASAGIDEIIHEVEVLSENTLESFDGVAEYLK